MPRRIPYPVTVNLRHAPCPRRHSDQVRQAVQELMAEAWGYRKAGMRVLHRPFANRPAASVPTRNGGLQDAPGNFGAALVEDRVSGPALETSGTGRRWWDLLPPSVAGALVNFAALLMGKVPVNLNYTVSEEALASCIRQCGIKTVLTSQVFLEKVKLRLP